MQRKDPDINRDSRTEQRECEIERERVMREGDREKGR